LPPSEIIICCFTRAVGADGGGWAGLDLCRRRAIPAGATKFTRGARVTGRLDMSLANDVQEVARVIDSLEEFGAANGIPADQSLRFGLALDELITNIISYGLAGRGDGVITLAIEHCAGALRAELADNGPPFDPLSTAATPPSGDIETREVGGLGLTLVKSFMDRLDYRRADGFNRLTMEMKVKAA
jgi:anti-sigma regulatory factor (Ser/Thr protein kinase)